MHQEINLDFTSISLLSAHTQKNKYYMCKERSREKHENRTKAHLCQLHNSFVTFITGL